VGFAQKHWSSLSVVGRLRTFFALGPACIFKPRGTVYGMAAENQSARGKGPACILDISNSYGLPIRSALGKAFLKRRAGRNARYRLDPTCFEWNDSLELDDSLSAKALWRSALQSICGTQWMRT